MDPPPSLPANQLFSLAGQNVLITGATRGWSLSLGIQPPFFFSSVHESRFHFVPDALLVHYHPLLRWYPGARSSRLSTPHSILPISAKLTVYSCQVLEPLVRLLLQRPVHPSALCNGRALPTSRHSRLSQNWVSQSTSSSAIFQTMTPFGPSSKEPSTLWAERFMCSSIARVSSGDPRPPSSARKIGTMCVSKLR